MSSSDCLVTGTLQGFKTVVSSALGDFQPKGLSLAVNGPPPWAYREATMEGREGQPVRLSSMETWPVPKAEKAGYSPEYMDQGNQEPLALPGTHAGRSQKSYRYPDVCACSGRIRIHHLLLQLLHSFRSTPFSKHGLTSVVALG